MDRLDSVTASVQGINNSVDDAERDSLKGIAEKIAQESLHGRDYTVFVQYLKEFVNTVAFDICLPVVSIKTLTITYIDMWNNPDVARQIMRNVYNINIEEDMEVLKKAPAEVRQHLSEEAIDIYLKALRQGKEKYKNIRLMVVGMFQVGKTSLVNNLIEDFEIKHNEKTKSTEGIDIHKCQIINRKWKIKVASLEDRMRNIKIPSEKDTTKPEIVTLIENEVHEERDMDHSESNTEQTNSKEEIIYERAVVEESNTQEKGREVAESVMHLVTACTSPTVQDADFEQHTDTAEPVQSKVLPPSVSVWDFAGQNIYYTTHHFFLNNRSIYLLLMDLSKPLDFEVECLPAGIVLEKFTCKDAFKFWLNSIHMYSLIYNEKLNVKPTIVLVGTHKDKLENKSEDEKMKHKDDYFNEALSEFQASDVLHHIYPQTFLVNNMDHKSPDFEIIRQTVEKIASEQSYWNAEVPARWIELEQHLDLRRQEGQALITYDAVKEANSQMTYSIHNEKQLRVFLETQHLLGNILYFETDELKNLVILNPMWAIEACRTFINHTTEINPVYLKQFNDYKKYAMLTHDLIDDFMKKADKSVKPHKKEVLGYLEKLDIIAKPVHLEDLAAEDEDKPIYVPRDFFIVPCVLKKAKCEGTIEKLIHQPENNIIRRTPVLCYEFKNGFMPPAVFHRLQASCIRSWEIKKDEDEFLLYNGFGVFHVTGDCTTNLVIWYKDHRIYFRFFVTSLRDWKSFTKVVHRTRITLESSLKAIFGIVSKDTVNRPYDEYIQCDRCPWEPGKHLFWKKGFENMSAKACGNHLVTFSHIFGYWFSKELPRIIKDKLKSEASDDQLSQLAQILVIEPESRCYDFGIRLGISQKKMEQLECDNKISSLTYRLLSCWGNYKRPIKILWKKMLELRMNIECFDQVFLQERHS